jgi:hypothetical protein
VRLRIMKRAAGFSAPAPFWLIGTGAQPMSALQLATKPTPNQPDAESGAHHCD